MTRDCNPTHRASRLTVVYQRITRLMDIGFALSAILMLASLALAALRGEPLGDEASHLGDVIPDALALEPRAVASLGILVLLATPTAWTLATLITFLRQRDFVFAAVCLALILILGTSVGIALL